MKRAFDVQHPFFIPLYRRVVVVAICLGWAVFEAVNGNTLWAAVFAAAGAWCGHQFFVAFDPGTDEDAKPQDDGPQGE